jgi:hypothetical protein
MNLPSKKKKKKKIVFFFAPPEFHSVSLTLVHQRNSCNKLIQRASMNLNLIIRKSADAILFSHTFYMVFMELCNWFLQFVHRYLEQA